MTDEPKPSSSQDPDHAVPTGAERYSAARARSEAKNQAVRDQLEPLEPGERPLAVTIASIVAMLFAVGNLVAFILSDNSTDGEESKVVIQTVLIFAILVVASIGMWFVKYWAVIGFQTILGLQIIVYSLALTRVNSAWLALLFLGIIGLSGVLFWFLIRAMARIQMPDSPTLQALQKQREEAEAALLEAEQTVEEMAAADLAEHESRNGKVQDDSVKDGSGKEDVDG